jgi:hypothetical protein
MALGVILAPFGKIPGAWPTGITQSYGAASQYVQPFDPQYNMRGEAGFYHDTHLGAPKLSWWQRFKMKRALRGLGAIPTDFEIGSMYNYQPVMSSWIASDQGYITPPWNPPSGQPPGGYPLPIQPNDGGGKLNPGLLEYDMGFAGLRGLRDDAAPATVEDVLATMQAHNDRVFALTLVSTTAVAVSAMITIFRTLRLIRGGGA